MPAAPPGSPAGRKRRQPAAKRRTRNLRSGRDATQSSRLIRRVRSQLKESAAQLAVEQQRYSDLVAEHFKLSQELLAGARAAWLELERLNALNKRLRSERDQARADSLRFNEERNALRREVAELRSRRSEAAVRDATRTRLSFPGTRAE